MAAIEDQLNNLILTDLLGNENYAKRFKRYAFEQTPTDDMVKSTEIEIGIPSSMDLRSLKVYTTCKTHDLEAQQVSIDVDDLLDGVTEPIEGKQLDNLVKEHMDLKRRILLDSRKKRRSTIFSSGRQSISRATVHGLFF